MAVLDLAALRPMLATPGHLPPDGSGFAYEFKWDGMRVLAAFGGGRVRGAVSRNGNDASARFPELGDVAAALGSRSAILDGELVVLGSGGRPDFGLMQARMALANARDIQKATASHPVQFLAFDLLSLGRRPLLREPYTARREALEGLGLAGPKVAVPPAQRDSGEAVLAASRELQLEGVVAKRLDSPYLPGERSAHWVKVRNRLRQELVVGGWTPGEGSRGGTIGALLLGVFGSPRGAAKLQYVGRVGSGFRAPDLEFLDKRLKALARPTSPFHPFDAEGDEPRFVRPELVCEVEFSGLASQGVLRQAAFKGFRADKPARDVVWEQVDAVPWDGSRA